ncbi:terpenoid synthase [Calocera cornea HHB12733]|uniref:(2E,6E)-farnesyl diphosphate synthase n=1 Tax=Calocera cornea HHB12733 TaxID=1353952 RepID=A0A165DW64_9BASI|nr:terpenoid synthase [Calocera cornea HHB12733]
MSAALTNGQDRRARFTAVFPKLEKELLDFVTAQGFPQEAISWFQRNLDYNAPGGKLNRGMSVVDSLEILRGGPLSEEEYFKSALLGWCVELLQAFFLVSDDIMDSSITRRGQPCWYRVEGIGMIAINDSFMLEGSIYHLLKSHFRKDSYYVDLLDLFHETTFQTELGQLIDLITAPEDHIDLNRFSLRKHQLIVIYKTAYYSFYLPVALAMHMAGIKDEAAFKHAQDILIPLGEYFQVQDDYLDCYGAPEFIGKIGTDILDNKCSWNVNVALANCSPEQRKVLDENYGRKDAACEAKVKEVFLAVDIPGKYAVYEQESYEKINGLINAIDETPGGLKRDVFRAFLAKIYKRTK